MSFVLLGLVGCLGVAQAQTGTIQGTVQYTGNLGPVDSERPLCLCLYRNASLTEAAGCYIFFSATAPYLISTSDANDYFVVAFLDIFRNESVDPEEPFEIYHDRGAPPGDPVTGGASGIDLIFGDENLPAVATATPTQTATPTETPTPTELPCIGDCDNSGAVTMAEVVMLLSRAVDGSNSVACGLIDADLSGSIEIDEVVLTVNSATALCASPRAAGAQTAR